MKTKTIQHWALGMACGIGVALAAQAQVWDMPNEYPATSVQGMGDKYFAERLQAKTQGGIRIVHHFGASLGYRSKDQLDAVADGAVVIANTFMPPLGGVNAIFLLSSLPFLVSNANEAFTLYEVAKPYYEKALTRYNQKLLYTSPWPASGLWGARAYDKPEAIKGLKMRTYDPNGTLVFRAAGAAPVQLSWADIVPQLTTGGIEAVLTSVESGLSASFNDYAKHFTALSYDTTINMVTINLDAWKKLSADKQKAVLEAAQETEQFLWKNLDGVIQRNYETAAQRGVRVTEQVDPDFRAFLQKQAEPVIAAWAKRAGKDGEALLSQYRQRLAAAKPSNN